MQNVSEFEVLKAISEENKPDGIGLCPDFVSVQTTKQGGTVTMGVPAQVIHWIAIDTHSVSLLVVKKEDQRRVRKELAKTGNKYVKMLSEIDAWLSMNLSPSNEEILSLRSYIQKLIAHANT